MNPLSINILIAMAVIIFFLVQGALHYRDIDGEDAFFLYKRKLLKKEYSQSFAAASISLATVLLFFVTLGIQYGIYILIAPLTYALGCYLYSKYLISPLDNQGFFSKDKSSQYSNKITLGSTLGNYVYQRYKSKSVKFSVMFVTFLGILSILLIELFVGVSIFSIYVQESYVDYALILIIVVVFLYTALGGLPAVVKTDKLQLRLIILSAISLLIWLVWSNAHNNTLPDLKQYFITPPILSKGFLLPYSLLFNIFIVNIFLIPSLLRTWQMAAASRSADDVRKGIMASVWFTSVLTSIFVLVGILFFKGSYPEAQVSLLGMLEALSESNTLFVSYFLFPIFFASCLAALISTADSALIPLLQSLMQDIKPEDNQGNWRHSKVSLYAGVILLVAVLLYFIVFRVLNFDLISWLFTIFSFLIVSTPAIVFAIIAPDDLLTARKSKNAALVSIWGGLIVAIILSLWGNKMGKVETVQLNSPIAALFGTTVFFILWVNHKLQKSNLGR